MRSKLFCAGFGLCLGSFGLLSVAAVPDSEPQAQSQVQAPVQSQYQSQSKVSTGGDSSEEVVVIKKRTEIYEGSSEYNRMNQSMNIGAQVIGVGPSSEATQGLYAAFQLDRNSLVLIEGTRSDRERGLFDPTSIKTRSLGVHYKQFLGNSFYVRGGIDWREAEYRDVYNSSYGLSEFDYQISFRGTSTAVSVSIGNQWTYRNFILGCDWIGGVQPLSHSFSEDRVSGSVSSWRQDDYEVEKKRLVSGFVTQGLRLYLGLAF